MKNVYQTNEEVIINDSKPCDQLSLSPGTHIYEYQDD